MKNNNYFKFLVGAIMLGSVITACDKFEDDVPPARMSSMQLHDDTYSTIKNQSVQLNVLANDTIGGTATVTFSPPQHGTLQPDSAGNVTYYPAPNFVGTDSFTYKACLDSNCATANIIINVQNDSTNVCTVKAFDDIRSFRKGTYYDSLRVMLNDNLCGETATNTTLSIVQMPSHGYAFTTTKKQIVYSPDTSFVGTDEVTYRITNSKGTSTAKVIFNITSAPQSCYVTARADSTSLIRHLGAIDTVSIAVLANDIICPIAIPVNLQLLSPSSQFGDLMVAYNGTQPRIIYRTKPNAQKNVMDTFQYRICQGNSCNTGSVFVYIK